MLHKGKLYLTKFLNLSSLILAAQNGYFKIVDLLLKNGAQVNCVAKDGFSPLLRGYENHATFHDVLFLFNNFSCL